MVSQTKPLEVTGEPPSSEIAAAHKAVVAKIESTPNVLINGNLSSWVLKIIGSPKAVPALLVAKARK